VDKGKLTLPFSAECLQISVLPAPPPAEAWRGAEICRRSTENGYIDLPVPVTCEVTFLYSKFAVKAASQPEKSTLTGTWGQCYKNAMVN
jgi:hypothetical protein